MMRKYLSIYAEFMATAVAEAMSFRLNFILVIIMDLLFYSSSLITVHIIFDHVSHVGPWSREEFLFFTAFMLTVDHIHMALISENFWNFSFLIRTGKLDFELLKPANTLFTVFLRHMRVQTLLITPVPWGALIFFGRKLEFSWEQWCSIPLFIILALLVLVAIEILISMLMFITVESFGINFLRLQLQQLARWPDFVYKKFARVTFTFFLPVLVIGSVPVKIILGEGLLVPLLFMFAVLLILAFLIGVSWLRALKYYESASS